MQSRFVNRNQTIRQAHPGFIYIETNGSPIDSIDRYGLAWDLREEWWNSTAFLTARFQTGEIKHVLLGGLEYVQENRPRDDYYEVYTLPRISLRNPDFSRDGTLLSQVATTFGYNERLTRESRQYGVYVQEQATLWEKLILMAGLR